MNVWNAVPQWQIEKNKLKEMKVLASLSQPGACIIKLITAAIYGFRNKLEYSSLASIADLVKCLWVKPGA